MKAGKIEKKLVRQKDATKLWDLLQRGINWQGSLGLKSDIETANHFYEGDQWYGLDTGGTDIDRNNLPRLNFIKPTVDHKINLVAMNAVNLMYSATGNEDIAQAVSAIANKRYETMKLDDRKWDVVRAGFKEGNAYLYFYDGQFFTDKGPEKIDRKRGAQVIESTNIFFGDEQQPDIQQQPYILIYERRQVNDVKEDARKYGVAEELIENIVSDKDCERMVTTGTMTEVETDDGKCSCLLYLELKDGALHFCRCTQTVVYQPMQRIEKMNVYPIASFSVNLRKGCSRGRGEVLPLIPNQKEYNKNLVRLMEHSKNKLLPKTVYARDLIVNPEKLDEAGAMIELETDIAGVDKALRYLEAPGNSVDVQNVAAILYNQTRDLANAGDAAVGNVNPENASGAAIIAAQDQSQIPLNEHHAALQSFFEQVADIILSYIIAYNPGGIEGKDGKVITQRQLEILHPDIAIDISSKAPISKYSRESTLFDMFSAGAITFEEFVGALDDDSNFPKAKLQEILEKRSKTPQPNMPEQMPTGAEALGGQQYSEEDMAEIVGVADKLTGVAENAEANDLINTAFPMAEGGIK